MWGRKRACVDGSFFNLSLGTPFKAVVTNEISSLVKGRAAWKRYLSIFEVQVASELIRGVWWKRVVRECGEDQQGPVVGVLQRSESRGLSGLSSSTSSH